MRKIIYIFTALILASLLVFSSLGGPGGSDDPLVSISYLKTIFTDIFEVNLKEKTEANNKTVQEDLDTKLSDYMGEVDGKMGVNAIIQQNVKVAVVEKLKSGVLDNATEITLKKGEKVKAKLGTKIIITQGKAKLYGTMGEVINLTRGSEANVNTEAPLYMQYFFASDNADGFEALENDTRMIIYGGFVRENVYEVKNTKYAQALFDLGLFRGTGSGFELENKGDRLQGIIMLIRLMGKEKEALKHSGETPFTDLTGWLEGHKYVGYGYDTKLTKGTNEENTRFSPSVELSPKMYYTFVLRALGYDDSKGDFHWEKSSQQKAVEIGLITQAEGEEMEKNGLYRDNIVKISYNALTAKLKNSHQTLGQKLIAQGVFTQNQFNTVAQNLQ